MPWSFTDLNGLSWTFTDLNGLLVEALVAGSSKFYNMIELLGGKIIIKEINGIYSLVVFMYLVMAMWAGRFSSTADISNNFSLLTLSPACTFTLYMWPYKDLITIPVIDHDMVAITIAFIPCDFNHSIGRGIYRRTLGSGEIKSSMKTGCFINWIDTITEPRGDSLRSALLTG